ncbi:MAG: hypothetical protein R6W68_02960 [Ignavibacteriaceae bacterium]
MLGFVNISKPRAPREFDMRTEKKRKKIIFNVVFAIIGFGLLNIVLYSLTRI